MENQSVFTQPVWLCKNALVHVILAVVILALLRGNG
jgi:hypothetical protein